MSMPNLFKITKNGKVSYLYATCHFQDDEVCTLSEETKQAFEQASCIVLEFLSEDQVKLEEHLTKKFDAWKMHAQPGLQNQLTDYLSFTQVKQIAELFADDLLQVHPSHLTLLKMLETSPMLLCQKVQAKQLKNLGFLGSDSLDNQLEKQAKLTQKPTAALDTLDDISARLLGFSFTYQEQIDYAKYFLEKQLNSSVEEIKNSALKLITAYLSGDIEELKKNNSSLEEPSICKAHTKYYAYERDPIFAQAMQPHLEAGNAFIAIGALHIPGVLSLLQENGCVIEPIQEENRIYKINRLKNTNKSLMKANLLSDYESSTQSGDIFSFFNCKSDAFNLQHKQDLPFFLELIREGKINRNDKIKIEIYDQFNDKELLILRDVLQEPATPKKIDVNLMNNISDENIAVISEIFRSQCSIEELNINFGYSNTLSEHSLECLTKAMETKMFTGKLRLTMGNNHSMQNKRGHYTPFDF